MKAVGQRRPAEALIKRRHPVKNCRPGLSTEVCSWQKRTFPFPADCHILHPCVASSPTSCLARNKKGKKQRVKIVALIEERIWPTCSNYCDERSSHQLVACAG